MAAKTCGYLIDGAYAAGDYTDLDTCAAGISANDVVTIHAATSAGSRFWYDPFAIATASVWNGYAFPGSEKIILASDGTTIISSSAAITMANLELWGNGGAHGLYHTGGALTLTNLLVRSSVWGIYIDVSGTHTLTNCLSINNTHGFGVNSGTLLTKHCLAMGNRGRGFYRVGGTMTPTDCVAWNNMSYDFDGTMTNGANCASLDNTHPATGGVLLTLATMHLHNMENANTYPLDFRPIATSALVGAGSNPSGATDYYGQAFANPSTIGPFKSWPLPTELAGSVVLTGNNFVILDGTTRTATASSGTESSHTFIG